jgi:hypothetical protein
MSLHNLRGQNITVFVLLFRGDERIFIVSKNSWGGPCWEYIHKKNAKNLCPSDFRLLPWIDMTSLMKSPLLSVLISFIVCCSTVHCWVSELMTPHAHLHLAESRQGSWGYDNTGWSHVSCCMLVPNLFGRRRCLGSKNRRRSHYY